MDHPILMLLPWAVFSLAVALKLWRFTALLRRHLSAAPTSTERVRRSLERIYQNT
jgi:hypothetical protein